MRTGASAPDLTSGAPDFIPAGCRAQGAGVSPRQTVRAVRTRKPWRHRRPAWVARIEARMPTGRASIQAHPRRCRQVATHERECQPNEQLGVNDANGTFDSPAAAPARDVFGGRNQKAGGWSRWKRVERARTDRVWTQRAHLCKSSMVANVRIARQLVHGFPYFLSRIGGGIQVSLEQACPSFVGSYRSPSLLSRSCGNASHTQPVYLY